MERSSQAVSLLQSIHPRCSSSPCSPNSPCKRPRSAPELRRPRREVTSIGSVAAGTGAPLILFRKMPENSPMSPSRVAHRERNVNLVPLLLHRIFSKDSRDRPGVSLRHADSADSSLFANFPGNARLCGLLLFGLFPLWGVADKRDGGRIDLPNRSALGHENASASALKRASKISPDCMPMFWSLKRCRKGAPVVGSVRRQNFHLRRLPPHMTAAALSTSSSHSSRRDAEAAPGHAEASSGGGWSPGAGRGLRSGPGFLPCCVASCAEAMETKKKIESGTARIDPYQTTYVEQPVIKVMNELGPCVVRVYRVKGSMKVKRIGKSEVTKDRTTRKPVRPDRAARCMVDYLGSGFVYKPEGK